MGIIKQLTTEEVPPCSRFISSEHLKKDGIFGARDRRSLGCRPPAARDFRICLAHPWWSICGHQVHLPRRREDDFWIIRILGWWCYRHEWGFHGIYWVLLDFVGFNKISRDRMGNITNLIHAGAPAK